MKRLNGIAKWILLVIALTISSVEAQSSKPVQPESSKVFGIVFDDANSNGRYDSGEKGLSGVRVSNGLEIVKTDVNGHYELSKPALGFIFVIKPSGWMTPVDKNNLPLFYYACKPGQALPQSIDFPLQKHKDPERFDVIFMADPQVSDTNDVHFLSHDIVEELIGTDAAFGVTLGDLINKTDRNLFKELNTAISCIGIPWYSVKGNHDIEEIPTFESIYGPTYYAFDYGSVHFIVMDNSHWGGDEEQREHQIAFLKSDLESIPQDQLVVLMMHITFTKFGATEKVLDLIKIHPNILTIGGHTHTQENTFFTNVEGWNNPKPLHNFTCGTASGCWWTGVPDELGIPSAIMRDGTPNGYNIITFDKGKYSIRYKVARHPADYQMNIWAKEEMLASSIEQEAVYVNIFAGSERSKAKMRVDNGSWSEMKLTSEEDPFYLALKKAEAGPKRPYGKRLPDARICTHLWKSKIPNNLTPGIHIITVTTTDMFGQVYEGHRTIVIH